MVVVELPEIFKAIFLVFPLLWSRPLTFQLLAVVYCVLKGKNQRLVNQIIVLQQRLSSKSLTILVLVEAFKIYARDSVLRHSSHSPTDFADDAFQVVFFALFTKTKKVRTVPPHSGSELPPHSSPWTPAAYGVPVVLEEEESEDEPDYDVEYVEHDGRWWGCEWVPARQQYCWWLAASDGSQAGHALWRPPNGSSAEGQGDGAWFDSGYMVCVSAWVLVPYCIFYVKGNSCS